MMNKSLIGILCFLLLGSAFAWEKKCDFEIKRVDVDGIHQIFKECKWDLNKKAISVGEKECTLQSARNDMWEFERSKCTDVKFKISAERKCNVVDEKFVVKVKFSIKNKGDGDSEGFKVFVKVQKKCEWDKKWETIKFQKAFPDKEREIRRGEVLVFNEKVRIDEDLNTEKCKFRVIIVVFADNIKSCDKRCSVDFEKEPFEFEKKVKFVKGECAKIVDETDCDKWFTCKFDCDKTFYVCSDDLKDVHYDEQGRECGHWSKIVTVKVCNDKCKTDCKKKIKVCNTVKLWTGKSKDWERDWCATDTSCIKVKTVCKEGSWKDKSGKKCQWKEKKDKEDECHKGCDDIRDEKWDRDD